MVSGIVYLSVFHVGALMAHGIASLVVFLKCLIYKTFQWMDQLLERMPARPGRQTAPPIMRHWGVPKAVLAVRSTPSVMAGHAD